MHNFYILGTADGVYGTWAKTLKQAYKYVEGHLKAKGITSEASLSLKLQCVSPAIIDVETKLPVIKLG